MLPKKIKKDYDSLVSELEKRIEGEKFKEVSEELKKAYITLEDYYTEKNTKIKMDFLDGIVLFSAIGGGLGYSISHAIFNSELKDTVFTALGAGLMVGLFLYNSDNLKSIKNYFKNRKSLYNEILSDYQSLKTLVLESKDSEICKEYIAKWNAVESKKVKSYSITGNWF
ncbi:MAG: hypothetical protein QXS41_02775 [Candidatus Woesearchaeota archaeon]